MVEVTWKGPDALRALLVPLRSLTVDPKNARRHPAKNIEAIRASLREFGQRKPIVHREAIVKAGNGTLQAADMEGWSHIAVVSADDLTTEQAEAYALADNQTGDLAEWDAEALRDAVISLPEVLKAATGFEPKDLQAIAAMAFGAPAGDSEGEGTPQEFATIKVTRDQYTIIKGAVAKVQKSEGAEVSEGRALELICAEFLS